MVFKRVSIGILILVSVLLGTGILIASTSTEYDPVVGFTDESCRSYDYREFLNMDSMDEYSDNPNNNWEYNSYIKYSDPQKCVRVLRVKEKPREEEDPEPAPGGGGSGGSRFPEPKESEPIDPADSFTEAEADELKECWEKKAKDIKKKIAGWDPTASTASEVTWGITPGIRSGFGRTTPDLENGILSIDVQIFPHGISSKIAQYPNKRYDFDHLVTFTQMHEAFHVAQILKIFNERETLPEPYEYWDMEVEASKGSNALWLACYGKNAGPPSLLREQNWDDLKTVYDQKTQDYKDLKEREANGTITEGERTNMEELATWLKDPNNLPQAEGNPAYSPETDLGCD